MDEEIETRILEKAAYVESAVEVLAAKRSLDEERYLNDREQRAIVEREFQTAIEACIDIAELLIKDSDQGMPSTNAAKFSKLTEEDLLSEDTGERMREAAGFRNVLAHQYGTDIDDLQVYHHLQNDLEWFLEFLREVRDYVKLE